MKKLQTFSMITKEDSVAPTKGGKKGTAKGGKKAATKKGAGKSAPKKKKGGIEEDW